MEIITVTGTGEGFHLALCWVSSCLFTQLAVAGRRTQTSYRWFSTCCCSYQPFKKHTVTRFGGFCLCCVFLPLAHIKGKLHYSGAIFTSLIYKQYHHVEMGKSNSVNKLDLGKIDELNLLLFLEGRLCFIFLTFPRPYTLNLYGFAQVWLGCLTSVHHWPQGWQLFKSNWTLTGPAKDIDLAVFLLTVTWRLSLTSPLCDNTETKQSHSVR